MRLDWVLTAAVGDFVTLLLVTLWRLRVPGAVAGMCDIQFQPCFPMNCDKRCLVVCLFVALFVVTTVVTLL